MTTQLRAVAGLALAISFSTIGCQPESADPELSAVAEIQQAVGSTYNVGPTRQFQTLAELPALAPGDLVLVDHAIYPAPVTFTDDGTASEPITIRGCIPGVANCIADGGGQRPVIKAAINQSGQSNMVRFLGSDHYVFENIEVDAAADEGNGWDGNVGTAVAIRHEANDVTLRNVFMHDCPWHGLLGTDAGSGSLTMEYSEIARCGESDRRHPVYMSTDPFAYPGAVFRLEHTYLHDGAGGNMVKSRAERNEIYYNWIENGFYRELELIGRDDEGPPPRPMHSDVVGNVFLKTNPSSTSNNVRVGHDWSYPPEQTGSHGRFRFVNNTFVLPTGSAHAIKATGALESIEMHNNVFYRSGGAAIAILSDGEADWISGRIVAGRNNWMTAGSTEPPEWEDATTFEGTDPGFLGPTDVRPSATSPLVDSGAPSAPSSPAGAPFPSPLYPPAFVPPLGTAAATATSRPSVGTIDIGAFESGSGSTCSFTIDPANASFAAGGGNGSIALIAPSGCSWTAQSNVSWVTITAGSSGSGSGNVAYSVDSNGGAARGGTITAAQQLHTIDQAAGSSGGGTVDVYTDQTNVTFEGGSAGVQATIASGEGLNGSNAIKHTNLGAWDGTKELVLPTAVDISTVQATDKLRISLDVSPGQASNIHVYFNGDWQTVLITPVLDQASGYQTFDIEIGETMRARLGNSVNEIYFKAGSGFPAGGTLWVDEIQFVTESSPPPPPPPPSGSLADVYIDQTNVTFAGGSAGVTATVASGEGVGGSNAIEHGSLQTWDATQRLVLPSAVDISAVQATDRLRISLDVSPGIASTIHVYFNNDWQAVLVTPVLDQTAGYQTFEIEIGETIRALLGDSVNDIYFKAGSGFPASGTLWVDDIQFVAP